MAHGSLNAIVFNLTRVLLLVGSALVLSNCSLKEPQKKNELRLRESEYGKYEDQLYRLLNKKYRIGVHSKASEVILHIINRLGAGPKTEVVVLDSSIPVVLSGVQDKIYLSEGMLKLTRYENELAFLLARELAQLRVNFVRSILTEHNVPINFSINDVFNRKYFDVSQLNALEWDRMAVRSIYEANYDPRGAVSLILRFSSQPGILEDHFMSLLPPFEYRLNVVRDEVAKLRPQKNPVVSSALYRKYASGR